MMHVTESIAATAASISLLVHSADGSWWRFELWDDDLALAGQIHRVHISAEAHGERWAKLTLKDGTVREVRLEPVT